jgi:hypothetical protein
MAEVEMLDTMVVWIENSLSMLLTKKVQRMDGKVVEGDVSIYWAGTVLRIDLKPAAKNGETKWL